MSPHLISHSTMLVHSIIHIKQWNKAYTCNDNHTQKRWERAGAEHPTFHRAAKTVLDGRHN